MTFNSTSRITVIRPDSRFTDGLFQGARHLLREISAFRQQIWTVYKQSFRSAYFASRLGVIWNFVLPLVPLTVYWFLSKIRVFPTFEGVDGGTFITFGVTIWFLLAGCVQTPIRVVQSRNDEAMKTSIPISVSIVSGFTELAFETMIRAAFVALVVLIGSSWPVWSAPGLVLVLLPGILLFLGVGLMLSIVNVIYRDVSRVVGILLQYGLFVSGVIFPLGESYLARLSGMVNPFSVFIDECRKVVFQGGDLSNAFYVWSLVSVALFVVGSRVFYIMEYRIRGIS